MHLIYRILGRLFVRFAGCSIIDNGHFLYLSILSINEVLFLEQPVCYQTVNIAVSASGREFRTQLTVFPWRQIVSASGYVGSCIGYRCHSIDAQSVRETMVEVGRQFPAFGPQATVVAHRSGSAQCHR